MIETTEQKVREIILSILGSDTQSPTSTTTFREMGADSIDVMEIFIEIEEEFGISIPDADANSMRTFGDIIKYLNERNK